MKILQHTDRRLRIPTLWIDDWSDNLTPVVEGMKEHLVANSGAAAVAANQVGCLGRFFVWKDSDSLLHTVVNPEIIDANGYVFDMEGCLSFTDDYGRSPAVSVGRYEAVEVVYWDLEANKEITLVYSDFEARVFQHEMEHLDGNLFIDNLTSKTKREFLSKLPKKKRRYG